MRVSTIYDKDLKEQVFMVRGDEAYARSTKLLMDVGSPIAKGGVYYADITVDVMRDVGDSEIIIYANDEPLLLYEKDFDNLGDPVEIGYSLQWSASSASTTVKVCLNYGVTYILYASYLGNSTCSPSKSSEVNMLYEDPRKTEAILSIDNNTIVYSEQQKTITVSNNGTEGTEIPDYNVGVPLTVYVDGLQYTTLETDDDGVATFNLPNYEFSSHTITVTSDETTNLYSETITQSVSYGIYAEVTSSPSIIIEDGAYPFTITVKDFNDNLIDGAYVKVGGYVSGDEYISGNTTSGIISRTATFSNVSSSDLTYQSANSYVLSLKLESHIVINTHTFNAENIKLEIPYVVPIQLQMFANPLRIYDNSGYPTQLTIDSRIRQENIPIAITNNADYSGAKGTAYTNESGLAYFNIRGNGKEDKTVTAKLGNESASLTFEDYAIWLDKDNQINWNDNAYETNGSLLYLTNAIRLDLSTAKNYFKVFTDYDSSDPDDKLQWVLKMEGVSSVANKTLKIGIDPYGNTTTASTNRSYLDGLFTLSNGTITLYKLHSNVDNNWEYGLVMSHNNKIYQLAGLVGGKHSNATLIIETPGTNQISFSKLTVRRIEY